MKKKIEDTIPEKILGGVLISSLASLPIFIIIIIWFGENELLMKMMGTSLTIFVTSLIIGVFIYSDDK